MEAFLSVEKIHKWLKDKHVLNDISSEVHRGEIIGIFG